MKNIFKNKNLSYAAMFLVLFCFLNTAKGQDREGINTITHLDNGNVMLEDFEEYEVGSLPSEWYNQRGNARPETYTGKDRKGYKYSVQKEGGNKYLHYEGTSAKHLNFPLVNKDVNIYNTPILSWKWRIKQFPEGGEDDDDKDAAASIYVVFDMGRVLFKKVPKSIRYTWSSGLEKGEERSKFFGNQKIIVMGTGDKNLGEWQTFNRNIVADYQRLFGDKPPETPIAILVLSDGDDTRNTAVADYDDIILKTSVN